MKIDFHTHCDSNEKDKRLQFAKACRENETIALISGGVSRSNRFNYPSNEETLKICGEYPEHFVPAARLDLWDAADPGDVWRYAEQGFKALKVIYPYYEYDHDIYMPCYEAAEKCGLPILFHTGNFNTHPADAVWKRPVLKNMRPLNLDRVARSFPKLKVVMAHLGTTLFRNEAAEMIRRIPNLYVDLAGSGSWMALSAEDMVALMGSNLPLVDTQYTGFLKILLGSDAYITHPHLIRESQNYYDMMMRKVGLPAELQQKIMGQTVAEWLNIRL